MGVELLWYIPNQVRPGHRGDGVVAGHHSMSTLTSHARALEERGSVATALAARTTTFQPLIAYLPEIRRQGNQLLPLLRG